MNGKSFLARRSTVALLAVCLTVMKATPCPADEDWVTFSKRIADRIALIRTARTAREKVAIARKLMGYRFWDGYERVNPEIIRPTPGRAEYRLKHVLLALLTVPDPVVRTAALDRLANYRKFRAEFEKTNEHMFFARPQLQGTEMWTQGDINPQLLRQMLALAADESEPALQKRALEMLRQDLRLRNEAQPPKVAEFRDQQSTDRIVELVTGGKTAEERQAAMTLVSLFMRARVKHRLAPPRSNHLVEHVVALLRSGKAGERTLGLEGAAYLLLNWAQPFVGRNEPSTYPTLLAEVLRLSEHSEEATRKRALELLGGTLVKFALHGENIRMSLEGNPNETIPRSANLLRGRQRALQQQAGNLFRMSRSPHPETREGALLLLASIRSPDYYSPVLDRRILEALGDPEDAVRRQAARLLITGRGEWPGTGAEVLLGAEGRTMGGASALPQLMTLALTEYNPWIPALLEAGPGNRAIRELRWGQITREIELENAAVETLDHPNAQRIRILAALWERGRTNDTVREMLRESARHDPNEATRWFLLQRFAETAETDPASRVLLLHALDLDYSEAIRTRTAELLGTMFPQDRVVRDALARAYVRGRIPDDENCRELLHAIGYLNTR